MITLKDLVNRVNKYNEEEVEHVIKAYQYAEKLHAGQKRESGEEYIMHPLNVAYILTEMHVDGNTICAGLLHDVIEDTNMTKENIAHEFNPDVASLVDGVTKMDELCFTNKQDRNLANIRKQIMGITEDPRIIFIKLADRLHNMRTLCYKKSEIKRIENSNETMDIYAPLAYYTGVYNIKNELEDLAFQHLKPDSYRKIAEQKAKIEEESQHVLKEMLFKIKRLLEDKNIPAEIKIRIKNIYGIYKKLEEGESLSEINDLLALKVMVSEVEDCYRTLGAIHQKYYPKNEKFKDYICHPKTNMYSSLHTTVFGPEEHLVQTQIRTFEMEKINSFGLAAYWDTAKGKAKDAMLDDLERNFQFFKTLKEIDRMYPNNEDFFKQIKRELFSERIYVNSSNGQIYELPKGANVIDLAYKISDDVGNTTYGAFVNNHFVPVDYVLKTKDVVRVATDPLLFGPKTEMLDKVQTCHAKSKIKEFCIR